MDIARILATVDHTLLARDAGWDAIRTLCEEAMRYGCASVCIPPSYVARAREYAGDRLCLCTVIGFPNGYNTTQVKVAEARQALADGADELDMVVNLGWVKDGLLDQVEEEIWALKAVAGSRVLKVIVETCVLTREEKIQLCGVVTRAGADFIKTSTGFAGGGGAFEDVSLFREYVGEQVRIKAAGGIATLEDAEKFLQLGASRLGTSRVVALVKAENPPEGY